MSGREMVSALELVGFEHRRTRGDHVIMRHPDGRGTTVPLHRELRPGTMRAILRQAGLTEAKLRELLGR